MENKVSVIIPVYNVEKFLRKCLKSVITQSFRNLEIIVVNDGSTDTSPKICEECAKLDSRIKVINKTNGGLSDARNAGMIHMTGQYIAFIDSDDFIDREYIRVLYDNAINNDADISICNYEQINEGENPIVSADENQDLRFFDRKEAMYALFSDELKMQFTTAWGKLYKRDIFNDIQYPKGRKYEDTSIAHLTYDRAIKTVYTGKKMYYYVIRSGSIKKSEKFIDTDMIQATYDKLQFFKNWGDKYLISRSYCDYLTCAMGIYARMPKASSKLIEKRNNIFIDVKKILAEMTGRGIEGSIVFRLRTNIFLLLPEVYTRLIRIR